MSETKVCPMAFATPTSSNVPYDCAQERCAWWVEVGVWSNEKQAIVYGAGSPGHCAALDWGKP